MIVLGVFGSSTFRVKVEKTIKKNKVTGDFQLIKFMLILKPGFVSPPKGTIHPYVWV